MMQLNHFFTFFTIDLDSSDIDPCNPIKNDYPKSS